MQRVVSAARSHIPTANEAIPSTANEAQARDDHCKRPLNSSAAASTRKNEKAGPHTYIQWKFSICRPVMTWLFASSSPAALGPRQR